MAGTTRAILAFVFFIASAHASAQTLTVRGTIADDTGSAGTGIQHASIALIRATDSTLASYTRSKSDGSFTLTADSPGRYILLATHLGSADFLETFSLTADSPAHEAGTITMLARERLIQEVLVRGRSAITIKGDTVEYAADSFAVREGATVEELLRKLPGLQVDRNGKITAQGETVQKILVDGEEFFSDDPAVVTQNLQAKAVDAVQIYDKKSDQAELTGIDDGERQKTINLKLKDAYKRGYFGKAQAAAGPGDALGTAGMRNGFYENQLMVNAFRNKRQISVFGIAANTGRAGLGWEDRGKYTGSGDNAVADEETGELYTTWWNREGDDNSTDWQGNFSGEGLPRAQTGGIHYADKWGANDAQHLSANYRASKIITENDARTTTQHILPDSTYTRTQDRSAFSDARRHRGDGLYEWKLDTAKSIRLTADAGWSNTLSNTRSNTRSFAEDGTEVNSSDRLLFSDATTKTQNASLTWRQKMAKKGRSLSINLRESWRESVTASQLDVTNTFFTTQSAGDSVVPISQRKDYNTRSLTLKGGASYTEPLSKTFFAEARYDIDLTDARSTRLSYDRTPGYSDYTALAREFSSDYDYHASTHTGGLGLRFVSKKVTLSGGSGAGLTRFFQDDLLFDTSIRRNYVNYFPRASFVWRIGRQRTLRLGYNGRTEQPSIEQIQPLRENTDPLNVVLGNPELKQQFHHTLNGNYNDYKVLTGAYTYAGFWGNITQDKLTQASTTDALGRRTSQWINVDGGYNFWAWAGYGRKIKPIDLQASININPGFSRTVAFINDVRSISTNNTYNVGLNLDRTWKKGKSDTDRAGISLRPEFTYNDNRSTISNLVTNYYQVEINGEAWVELPANFRISTSAWINLRQRTDVFPTNNNVVRWDAYVARKFLKDKTLEARIAIFDILNENIGFSRNASPTNITENRYLTVRRYGLLSLVWNFTKSTGGAGQSDAMKMIGG